MLRFVDTHAEEGLTSTEAQRRRAEHGPNALPERPPRPLWRTFARQFKSPLIYILLVAAVLAVALGHQGDALVILAVLIVNALIGAAQEGRAERSMAALRRLSALRVRVLRGGNEQSLEARELVPGDILLLAAGDAVGADARLIEEAQLQVAEAALTGESVPVAKAVRALSEATGLADRHNMVYSGTHVTAGRAHAVVVATGVHTEVGRIAGLTEAASDPKTPLEQRIEQFGRWLVGAALGLFVIVVLLGLWRSLPLAEVLMVAISQMVSMVPEGLPVAMTIALAVGMQRMAGRGAIIRRLSAVETLGSTTVICSDKTGTLTRNEMTVTALWLPGEREIAVSGIGYAPAGSLTEGGQSVDAADPALATLLHAAALCNDAELLPPADDQGAWTVLGDPTEGALRVLAAKAGLALDALARAAPREAELPFDSDTKLMATRHRWAGAPRRVFVKGAPEAVLRLTAADGAAAVQAARAAAEAMAARALRVLAFAVVEDDPLDTSAGFDALAGRAHLLGLVGQIDPPREEVKAAVAECRAAGIRPVMVTGDHKLTGLAIARELGIARFDDTVSDRAVDGPELERMGEADLRDELERIAVFARVQPAQKLRIVEALQARGEVVAMTGDGVNDAPALRRADIGIALGQRGSDVAREASDMVVTDDDLATIVTAVREGRGIYDNIRKVVDFLVAGNLGEILVVVGGLLAFPGLGVPLLPLQLLWINLLTDGMPAIALGVDPIRGDLMRRPPRPRQARLLAWSRLRPLLLRGALIAAATLAALAAARGWLDAPWERARAVMFTTLVLAHLLYAFNVRPGSGGPFSNRWLLLAVAGGLVAQLLVVLTPALQGPFGTVTLSGREWLLVAAAGILPALLIGLTTAVGVRLRGDRA